LALVNRGGHADDQSQHRVRRHRFFRLIPAQQQEPVAAQVDQGLGDPLPQLVGRRCLDIEIGDLVDRLVIVGDASQSTTPFGLADAEPQLPPVPVGVVGRLGQAALQAGHSLDQGGLVTLVLVPVEPRQSLGGRRDMDVRLIGAAQGACELVDGPAGSGGPADGVVGRVAGVFAVWHPRLLAG